MNGAQYALVLAGAHKEKTQIGETKDTRYIHIKNIHRGHVVELMGITRHVKQLKTILSNTNFLFQSGQRKLMTSQTSKNIFLTQNSRRRFSKFLRNLTNTPHNWKHLSCKQKEFKSCRMYIEHLEKQLNSKDAKTSNEWHLCSLFFLTDQLLSSSGCACNHMNFCQRYTRSPFDRPISHEKTDTSINILNGSSEPFQTNHRTKSNV